MVAPTGSLAWRKEVWAASLALSRHVISPLDATAKVWMTGAPTGQGEARQAVPVASRRPFSTGPQ